MAPFRTEYSELDELSQHPQHWQHGEHFKYWECREYPQHWQYWKHLELWQCCQCAECVERRRCFISFECWQRIERAAIGRGMVANQQMMVSAIVRLQQGNPVNASIGMLGDWNAIAPFGKEACFSA